jgi:hypothetical protein
MPGPGALPFLVAGGAIATVGGVVYAVYLGEKKRNAAMQIVAQTMGFSYEEACDGDSLALLGGDLPVFQRGHSKKAKRVMRGKLADRDVTLCDYTYTTGGGKSSHTHRQTLLLFTDGARGMPDFALSPENVFHRLAEIFGYQDIDFDQYPEFSKRYLLRGEDEAGIRRVFTSEALAFLGGTTGWCVQTRGGRLAIFREGKYIEPGEVPSHAAEALRIAGVLKPAS